MSRGKIVTLIILASLLVLILAFWGACRSNGEQYEETDGVNHPISTEGKRSYHA